MIDLPRDCLRKDQVTQVPLQKQIETVGLGVPLNKRNAGHAADFCSVRLEISEMKLQGIADYLRIAMGAFECI